MAARLEEWRILPRGLREVSLLWDKRERGFASPCWLASVEQKTARRNAVRRANRAKSRSGFGVAFDRDRFDLDPRAARQRRDLHG